MARMFYRNLKARMVGAVKGRKVYRIPVIVRVDGRIIEDCEVLAHNATEAANLMRREYASIALTEVVAFGPQGGEVRRWVGWESAIGHTLMTNDNRQLGFGV